MHNENGKRRLPNIVSYSVTAKMEPNLRWIQQQLNADDAEVSRMVQMLPNILYYSIENKMGPNLEWFRQRLNLDDSQVAKVVIRMPHILYYSITDKMEPNLNWIQQRLLISDTELAQLICKQPSLLGFNISANLEPTINFYFDAIETDEDVVAFILKYANILTYSLGKRLQPRLTQAKESGMKIDTVCLRQIAMLTNDQWSSFREGSKS